MFEELSRQERRGFRLRRYHADTELLIITIPTPVHEALHLSLARKFEQRLPPTAFEIWISIGSTTFRSQGHPGGDGGEGDSSGGPIPARHYDGAWPTLVIEAGVSEPLNELHMDMRWWFAASAHQVKIVLLTKFDRSNRCIIIERWEEDVAQPRLGATMTRMTAAAGAFQPVLRQRITITRDVATDSFNVDRSALVLSFQLLFLRGPGPTEGNIVISVADLQAYARHVWGFVRD